MTVAPVREQLTGRFDAALDDVALLGAVGVIARRARRDAPENVSEREFDAVAGASEYEGLPSARAIAMRLGMSWPEVVAAGLKPRRERQQVIASLVREEALPHLSDRHVFFALNKVARELEVRTLSSSDYVRGLDRVNEREARRWQHGAPHRRLPTLGQLLHWARDRFPEADDVWSELLALASLDQMVHRERQRDAGPRGYPRPLLVAGFARLNQRWPTGKEAQAFARLSGTPVRKDAQPWHEVIGAAEHALEAEGAALTDIGPALTKPPAPYLAPLDGIPGAPRFTKQNRDGVAYSVSWWPSKVVHALAEFDRLAPTRRGRAEALYRTMLPDHPDWPSVSTVIRLGGWDFCMRHATTLNRTGKMPREVLDLDDTPEPTGELALVDPSHTILATGPPDEMRRARDRALAEREQLLAQDAAAAVERKRHAEERRQAQQQAAKRRAKDRVRARRAAVRSAGTRTGGHSSAGRTSARSNGSARTARGAAAHLGVGLAELVAAGALRAGEVLQATRREERWTARVTTTGTVDLDGVGEVSSPTKAAMQVLGRPQDGWRFWKVRRDGSWMPLARVRDEYVVGAAHSRP